jgi:hypothetical protein
MKHLPIDVTPYLKEVEGIHYIPWARALALAGNPVQEVILHPQTGPLHPIFGGGAVAIRQGNHETWLPVTDARNQPIPFGAITARDVGDALNRARARSVALVNGLGLGLYVGQPNGTEFVRALGVTSATEDLSSVEPLTDEKRDEKRPEWRGPVYLPWAPALAAASITDPEFRWSFVWFDTPDENGVIGRQPYVRLPKGYLVAVDLAWKGQTHREYLPIMGVLETQTKRGLKRLDHRTVLEPTVTDWHRAVMRCLAKGIAILTGYGRSVYASEIASPAPFADAALIEEIATTAAEAGVRIDTVLRRANVPTLEALSPVVGARILAALQAKRARAQAQAQANAPAPAVADDGEPVPQDVAVSPEVAGGSPGSPSAAAEPTDDDAAERDRLLAEIEAEAEAKGISAEMLRGFFGRRPEESKVGDLMRVLRALKRAVPSAQRKAGHG